MVLAFDCSRLDVGEGDEVRGGAEGVATAAGVEVAAVEGAGDDRCLFMSIAGVGAMAGDLFGVGVDWLTAVADRAEAETVGGACDEADVDADEEEKILAGVVAGAVEAGTSAGGGRGVMLSTVFEGVGTGTEIGVRLLFVIVLLLAFDGVDFADVNAGEEAAFNFAFDVPLAEDAGVRAGTLGIGTTVVVGVAVVEATATVDVVVGARSIWG